MTSVSFQKTAHEELKFASQEFAKGSSTSEISRHLENAYQAFQQLYCSNHGFTKVDFFLLADLFYLKGRITYGENLRMSGFFFKTSLTVSFVAIRILKPRTLDFLGERRSLQAYAQHMVYQPHIFSICYKHLLTHEDQRLINKATKHTDSEHILLMGSAFRCLTYICQHFEKSIAPINKNFELFKKLLFVSSMFLCHAEKQEKLKELATFEIANLLYQTGPFFASLSDSVSPKRDPNSLIFRKVEALDPIHSFLKDSTHYLHLSLRAKVYNLQSVFLYDLVKTDFRKIKDCYEKSAFALVLSNSIKVKERNHLLHHLIMCNKANFAMDYQEFYISSPNEELLEITSEKIKDLIMALLQYVYEQRPRHQNTYFFMTAARYCLHEFQFKLTLEFLTLAVENQKDFPQKAHLYREILLTNILKASAYAAGAEYDPNGFLDLTQLVRKR